MNVFDSMMSAFSVQTESDYRNALHEVMQKIALAGLNRSDFFKEAAFYGGTCLHLFHGLPRFSEDLDFSLLQKDPNFSLVPELNFGDRPLFCYQGELNFGDRPLFCYSGRDQLP